MALKYETIDRSQVQVGDRIEFEVDGTQRWQGTVAEYPYNGGDTMARLEALTEYSYGREEWLPVGPSQVRPVWQNFSHSLRRISIEPDGVVEPRPSDQIVAELFEHFDDSDLDSLGLAQTQIEEMRVVRERWIRQVRIDQAVDKLRAAVDAHQSATGDPEATARTLESMRSDLQARFLTRAEATTLETARRIVEGKEL